MEHQGYPIEKALHAEMVAYGFDDSGVYFPKMKEPTWLMLEEVAYLMYMDVEDFYNHALDFDVVSFEKVDEYTVPAENAEEILKQLLDISDGHFKQWYKNINRFPPDKRYRLVQLIVGFFLSNTYTIASSRQKELQDVLQSMTQPQKTTATPNLRTLISMLTQN